MVLAVSPPQTLTVDLAGDEPVPVAGTTFDPTAGLGSVAGTVREFELLLSEDGATYESVPVASSPARSRTRHSC